LGGVQPLQGGSPPGPAGQRDGEDRGLPKPAAAHLSGGAHHVDDGGEFEVVPLGQFRRGQELAQGQVHEAQRFADPLLGQDAGVNRQPQQLGGTVVAVVEAEVGLGHLGGASERQGIHRVVGLGQVVEGDRAQQVGP
jgi:hypothetical protein